jgi:histidinol-phosphate aminotransferase
MSREEEYRCMQSGTKDTQDREKWGVTRRDLILATMGTIAAAPLCFQAGCAAPAALSMRSATDRRVRLDMNENPFGASPKALAAASNNLSWSSFYLDEVMGGLYHALMRHNAIPVDRILLGTGSWEVLRIAFLARFENDGDVVSTWPTFNIPLDFAKHLGYRMKSVDHSIDPGGHWHYDVEGLLKAVDSRTRVLYLVNPNNPTGACLDYRQLKYMADSLPPEVLFLIDEAYVQFLPDSPKTGIDLVREGRKNVLVTRTFSKVYGLAGMRVGYGVAHPDVIRHYRGFAKDFLSMNTSGFYGAIAALEDTEFVSKCVAQALKTLSFYKEQLSALGLSHIIGKGPFVMVDVETDADRIVEKMAEKGVLVAPGREWKMPTHIRISYGTESDNSRVMNVLRQTVSS